MISYFSDLYYGLLDYLATPDFARIILAAKIIGWLIIIFFITLIIILLKRSDAGWWIRERRVARDAVYGTQIVGKKWREILIRLELGDDANMKLAVLEADNIVDDILKKMALPGRNFEERLRQFEQQELPSLSLLWEAHGVRDKIVKDPNFQISKDEAKRALEGYEAALKDLEYLD